MFILFDFYRTKFNISIWNVIWFNIFHTKSRTIQFLRSIQFWNQRKNITVAPYLQGLQFILSIQMAH